MVTVEFFKNLPFNGSNKMSNFADAQAQEDYFSSVPTADKLVLTDVKVSSLYEPILVNKTLDELYPYTYGRIKFNSPSGQPNYAGWYYFSIDRYEINTAEKTYVHILFDYWETYRYDHSNGTNRLTIGRSLINRCSLDLGCRMRHAYTPLLTKQVKKGIIDNRPSGTVWFNAIATYHINSTNTDVLILLVSRRGIQDIVGFDWAHATVIVNQQAQNIDPNQIMGIWYSPFAIDPVGWAFGWSDNNSTTNYNMAIFSIGLSSFNSGKINGEYEFTSTITESPSERSTIGITDSCGNLVWVSDIDSLGPTIKFSLNVSMTTARWFGYIERDGGYTNGECMFTIPCEPIDIFSDAFIAYYTQQRPFTEQQRYLQKQEAALNNIGNMASATSQGAMIGMLGGPVGAVTGAVAGLVGSAVGTAINYYTADSFAKAYQKIEDRQAKMQTDNLRFEGSALMDIALGYTGVWVVAIESDIESWTGYQNDIAAFGYYYNTEYVGIENLLSANPTFKLTCNAEIENVPAIAERSVKSRLQAGVEFIRPTPISP